MTTNTAVGANRAAVADGDLAVTADPSGRPRRGASLVERGRSLAARTRTAVGAEPVLIAVLLGSFLARLLLADRNSYWFDELLSVQAYAAWHDGAGAAVAALATDSVHPPLYQFILYHWVEWFGESERATRSLSNVYITLATLFLYLLVREAFSRRVALATAVTFALMYTPLYYGLESRSYAQTIFLATLSSYALLRLMRAGSAYGWPKALRSPTMLLFTAAGTALLLTHYFNAFFWIAQGIMAGFFVLRERPPRGWFAGLAAVAALYAAQAVIFCLIWGRVLLDDFHRRGGRFAVEDNGIRSPYQLLDHMVTPNIDAPGLVRWLGLAIGLVVLLRAIDDLVNGGVEQRQRAWAVIYLLGWLLLPFFVITAVFEITGVARYVTRYWLAAMPALAPLLVLTVGEAVTLVRYGLRRLAPRRLGRLRAGAAWSAWSTTALIIVVAILVLPGTVQAGTEPKHPWRGMSEQVVDIVRADPDHDYIIYEASYRDRPLIQYYFDQFSDEIDVHDTVRRSEENSGEARILSADRPLIARHDYLVLMFPHLLPRHFPNVLGQLSERYHPHLRQVDKKGRGFIIFQVKPAGAASGEDHDVD